MKVIGYERKMLNFNDGRSVDGYFMYLSDDSRRSITGVMTERIYLSLNRACGYSPALGDEIKVFYNKFGKVDSVQLVKPGKAS